MIIRKVPDVVPQNTVLDSHQAYQIQRDTEYFVVGSELVYCGNCKRFIISEMTRNVAREHTFIYIANRFYPISIKPFYLYEPLQKQGTSLLCKEGIKRYHEIIFSKMPQTEFLTDKYLHRVGNVLRYKDRNVHEVFNQVLCMEPRLFKFTNNNNLTSIINNDIDDFAEELTDIYYGSNAFDDELFGDNLKQVHPDMLDVYVKLKNSPRASIKRALRQFEPQVCFNIHGDLFTKPSLEFGVISQKHLNDMFRLGVLEQETETCIDKYMEYKIASCDVYDCNDWYLSNSFVEFLQSCPYTDIRLTFVNNNVCDAKYGSFDEWILEDKSYVENIYLDIVYEGSEIVTASDGLWCKTLFERIDDLVDLFYSDREDEDDLPIKMEFLYHNQVAMIICYTKTTSVVHCYDLILYNAISTSLIFEG